jgi:signal recognition particle subunit SRP54
MDPVKIAEEGVAHFKKQNYDIIIVDTSGRHKQEQALFDEMKQVEAVCKPDDIVFVMDSHIGQACHDQATAFKSAVAVGSVIITKLDGHAKGGGALSAVAATASPVVFIGTGEYFEDFETFDPESFIKRLLGLGDLKGLFEKVKEVVSVEKQQKLAENIQKGIFTMRDMRDQYQSVLSMGPLDKVMSMIPGLSSNLLPKGKEKEAQGKIKKFLCMMDSMTNEELDCIKKINDARIKRIARGSGSLPAEVHLLIDEYNKFAKMVDKMGSMAKKPGNLKEMTRNPGQLASKLSSFMPQDLLQGIGADNMMNMVKEMTKMEGMNVGGKKKGNR